MVGWKSEEIRYYYDGIKYGDYPHAVWQAAAPYLPGCQSLLDVGSGPGAFALTGLAHGWQVTAVDISELALTYLRAEAARLYPAAPLIVRCGNFCTMDLPAADIVVAAFCFFGDLATEAALGRMMDLARRLAVFTVAGDYHSPSFGAERLPPGTWRKPQHYQDNGMLESMYAAAAARRLQSEHHELVCDFGCPYDAGDENLLNFIARKTRVEDRALLARHLAAAATEKNGIPWVPNLRRMSVYLIKK